MAEPHAREDIPITPVEPSPAPPHPAEIVIPKAAILHQSVVFGPPIVVILLMLTVAVLYLLEQPPIRYLNSPFPTDTTVVSGGRINPQVFHCDDASRAIFTITARRLVPVQPGGAAVQMEPGSIYFLPPASSSSPDRGCIMTISDETVPANVPPGVYVMESYSRVSGRWRDFIVHGSSQPFEVIAAPITGSQGPQGEIGPQGETGPEGPRGQPGEPGQDSGT